MPRLYLLSQTTALMQAMADGDAHHFVKMTWSLRTGSGPHHTHPSTPVSRNHPDCPCRTLPGPRPPTLCGSLLSLHRPDGLRTVLPNRPSLPSQVRTHLMFVFITLANRL